jgi:hypothetical protein
MTFKERRYECPNGHSEKLFRWDTDPNVPKCRECGETLQTEFQLTGKAPCVIGDEIDVMVEHGLCNEDGSPKRYRSRSDLRHAAKALGWTNAVEHKPLPGTDKSLVTSRWV